MFHSLFKSPTKLSKSIFQKSKRYCATIPPVTVLNKSKPKDSKTHKIDIYIRIAVVNFGFVVLNTFICNSEDVRWLVSFISPGYIEFLRNNIGFTNVDENKRRKRIHIENEIRKPCNVSLMNSNGDKVLTLNQIPGQTSMTEIYQMMKEENKTNDNNIEVNEWNIFFEDQIDENNISDIDLSNEDNNDNNIDISTDSSNDEIANKFGLNAVIGEDRGAGKKGEIRHGVQYSYLRSASDLASIYNYKNNEKSNSNSNSNSYNSYNGQAPYSSAVTISERILAANFDNVLSRVMNHQLIHREILNGTRRGDPNAERLKKERKKSYVREKLQNHINTLENELKLSHGRSIDDINQDLVKARKELKSI